MINKLIEFSLKNRYLILLAYVLLAGWGYWALLKTPIDAIPDLSENQVIVFSDWPGRSPQEVEDQITYPLTVNLQGLPSVKTVRSSSAFGFSMINIIFEDDVDVYFARTRVLERLNLASGFLPAGVVPTLGPDATGVGQVFWYTVEGPTIPARCVLCKTGSSGISSIPCRASRKSPASAALSGNIKSTSIPANCALSIFRSARFSKRSSAATTMSARKSSRRTTWSMSFAASV